MKLSDEKIEMLRNIFAQYVEDCDSSQETAAAVDFLFDDICKLNDCLILPLTALDNAVLEHGPGTPDIDWRSKMGDNLWIGVQGLSVKLRNCGDRLDVDIFDDVEAPPQDFAGWDFPTEETCPEYRGRHR